MPRIPIVGYADRFSLQPGETIGFKVSSGSAEPYAARLVRVISGDPSPEGPGLIEQDIEADFAAGYPSRFQPSHLGSYMQVTAAAPLEGLESFTFGATIGPTTPDRGQQGVVGRFDPKTGAGLALVIGPNGAAVLAGDGSGPMVLTATGKPLVAQRWYRVWASYDATTRSLRVVQQPLVARVDADDAGTAESTAATAPSVPLGTPLVVAALGTYCQAAF